MTVSVQDTVFRYTANGVTTPFAYSCLVLAEADLVVTVDGVEVTAGFTVSGIGSDTGGNVVFTTAPANGASVIVRRLVALERTTDYQQHGDWLADVVNPDFDRLWMAEQQQAEQIDRSVKFPVADGALTTELPAAALRANKLLSFDANGNVAAVALAAQSATALQIDLADSTDVIKGDALIGVKRTLTGAVATTLHLWNEAQWINAKADYSLTADGVAADTVRFQAMATDAATAGKIVYLGSGTFRLTDTITSKPVLYIGDGAGKTTIVFDSFSGKNGFTFTAANTVGMTAGFIGVEFVAKAQNGLTAIECPKDATQYDTYYTKWIFRDLYMHGNIRDAAKYGFAWDFSFAKWIRASDCNGLTIENVNIQGAFDIKVDPAGQLADIGIELDAASALLSARIRNVAIGPIHTAIAVGDRAFFSIADFDLIGTYRGIYQTGTTIYNEPKIGPGNINAQETGIYFEGSDARDIQSVTIRRHSAGWKSATNIWYGIKAINCTSITMARNLVQPDESAGAFTGTMYAYYLKDCALTTLSQNTVGAGNDIGVHLDNCTGMNVDGTISAQSAAGNVLFNLINNTRITTIGNYELVSSFVGTVLAKDVTVVGAIQMLNQSFDLQGTGNITRDTTRVNAAADTKIWREVTTTTGQSRQVLTDAGVATNYEIVTRSGVSVTQMEWRATQFKLNNGPIFKTGSNTPEGVVTADVGSFFLRVNGGAVTTFYVKETGTGNTGWVAK